MRTRAIGAVAAVLAWGGIASAQYGTPGVLGSSPVSPYPPAYGGNLMPNIYNPRTQPLSPYLNLFGYANPGVNYFYSVRPGTVGGAGNPGYAPSIAQGGNRAAFFPQLAMGPDPFENSLVGTGSLTGEEDGGILPPAGHQVVYGNTLGYFPSPMGSAGRNRPGLSGIGTTRPSPGRKK